MVTGMRWRGSLLLGAAIALTFGLLAALPAEAKTFRFALQADAVSMDPYTINETMTLGFLSNIYEGLVRRGGEGRDHPGRWPRSGNS